MTPELPAPVPEVSEPTPVIHAPEEPAPDESAPDESAPEPVAASPPPPAAPDAGPVASRIAIIPGLKPNVMLDDIAGGRTDRVFDFVASGNPATTIDRGVSLINRCAYYGDVSAIRFLLSEGESLESLGENFDLNGAAFHGHWQLCQFLIENGADVNLPLQMTGETPLHAALCTTDRSAHNLVLRVLLARGAEPNCVTLDSAETGAFMRDARTRGETPLHRAAAFGDEEAIRLLIEAGAMIESRDAFGDTPLAWASWYLRPVNILRLLCYGDFRIHPGYRGMRANLLGEPNL